MRVSMSHSLGDLEGDFRTIARKAPSTFRKVVVDQARAGNRLAKSFAKESARTHGKLYPRSFTVSSSTYYGFGGGTISAEYGPEVGLPQGGMEFERGSRNQKPHLDLNRSADVIGPALAFRAGKAADDLFWPNS